MKNEQREFCNRPYVTSFALPRLEPAAGFFAQGVQVLHRRLALRGELGLILAVRGQRASGIMTFSRPMRPAPNFFFISLMRLRESHHSKLHFKMPRVFLSVCMVLAIAVGAAEAQEPARADFAEEILPVLREFCIDCHGPDEQSAEIGLHRYADLDAIKKDRKTWEKVLRRVKFQAMPPGEAAQPSAAQREKLVAWLDDVLYAVDCNLPHDPGRVTIRRLNRHEYNNTIRDLMGVDFDPAADFPSDDVGEGFDNIGDVLSLSPLLFEKYMDAAEQIASRAILVPSAENSRVQRREKKQLQSRNASLSRGGTYGMSSQASVTGSFDFPRDGDYLLRGLAGAQQAGSELAKLEYRLDDKKVEVVEVKSRRDDIRPYDVRLRVTKGKHRFTAEFINDFYNPKDPDPKNRDRNMYVRALEVVGPVDWRADDFPESHRRLITSLPSKEKSPHEAAREVLAPFVERAFRRPVAEGELDPYLALFDLATKEKEPFERALQVAVSAVLVSPHFLFRIEQDPQPDEPNQKRQLNDFELATRMSYFLWSSMPDRELFDLARRDELHKDDVLRRQISRMLSDPKSASLVENFAAQWLNLRNLELVTPDPKQFGDFSDALRADMQRETLKLFETVMRENRSLLDFISADFTFLNARLAKHYGIPNVEGDQFRRVSLAGTKRAGVLTHASILTLTSNPTRTSPVKRGKWIMENILGTPPPDPPAGVPELAETQKVAPDLSLRQQLELHRKNPTCAVCHREMDVLGLGFENFDPIGRWRDRDADLPIDATGSLPGGGQFSTPAELVGILAKQKDQFSRSLSKKMLTYALGRGVEYYDRCAIDDITKALRENDYRFEVLVTEIIKSEPFQLRRGDGGNQ